MEAKDGEKNRTLPITSPGRPCKSGRCLLFHQLREFSRVHLVGFLLDGGNPLGLVGDNQTWKLGHWFTEGIWISTVGTSVDWDLVKLVVTVLQQCCLECLVNPTVRSSLIELKFGRGVVDWFILDLYGGISLWLPESL
ncbi:hypothetical protein F2Q70_00021132 [Brassica cretica]|uniref:Uncharacterized protein n=1 Tax=Brassica cretica TaxID=69181 RepID=A0A8S9GUD4_BRACR|nr:hypothetical protein F2Q70_00021132 [Brassica cretica]